MSCPGLPVPISPWEDGKRGDVLTSGVVLRATVLPVWKLEGLTPEQEEGR